MNRNLAAYTPSVNPFPPFVSINETLDGFVEIIVRGPITDAGECGAVASIRMTPSEFHCVMTTALAAMLPRV